MIIVLALPLTLNAREAPHNITDPQSDHLSGDLTDTPVDTQKDLATDASAAPLPAVPVLDTPPYIDEKNDIIIADHKEIVDKLVSTLIGNGVIGLTVGLANRNESAFFGYGQTANGGPLPDEHTMFEIGSVTKTFTGLVLAKAVLKKQLRLNQTVQQLMPSGKVSVPKKNKAITLEHLATHTSGLSFMPGNIKSLATYKEKDLYNFLNMANLFGVPGVAWQYSNLGSGLLGHSLSLHAKKCYSDMIKEEILEPLELHDTTISISEEQAQRIVQPHNRMKLAVPIMQWGSDALVGAGALRSSTKDMLQYAAAQAGIIDSSLAQAMALSQKARFSMGGSRKIGLAWFIEGKQGFYYHEGETDGCTAYLGFDPRRKTCVVVLANTLSTRIKDLGFALQKMMAAK